MNDTLKLIDKSLQSTHQIWYKDVNKKPKDAALYKALEFYVLVTFNSIEAGFQDEVFNHLLKEENASLEMYMNSPEPVHHKILH